MRKYLPALRALVSIATLAVLFKLYDLRSVMQLVHSLPADVIASAIALFALTTAVSILKWRLALPQSVSFLSTARGYVASYFYSLLPTGQMGAELGKVVVLANHASLGTLAGSVVFDKLTGLSALCLIGSLACTQVPSNESGIWMPALVIGMFVACITTLTLAAVSEPLLKHLLGHSPLLERARDKIHAFAVPMANLVRTRSVLFKSVLLGILSQLGMLAIYVLLGRALAIQLPLAELSLLVVVANLATLIPVSLGGLGVREASLVGLLTQRHVPGEAALALSLAAFSIFLLGALAGGAIELHELTRWFRHPKRPRKN